MKRLIMILISLLPILSVFSRNYFKVGTRWIVDDYYMNSDFTPGHSRIDYWLEDTDTDGIMELYERYDKDNQPQSLQGFIKTEGEKVYFNIDKEETSPWFLLYDFSLKPGEGALIYALQNYYLSDPPHKYVRCVSTESDPKNPEWEIMNMEVFDDEVSSVRIDKGKWIKSLGSVYFLCSAFAFDEVAGGRQDLREVYSDGELIYSNPSAGVSPSAIEPKHSISLDGLRMTVSNESGENVSVYSVTGKIVATSMTSSSILLPQSGIYIIKIGGRCLKIHAKE